MTSYHQFVLVSRHLVLLALFCLPDRVEAQSILFVSPLGNDAWSGRLDRPNGERTDGPLATIQTAVEQFRQEGAHEQRSIVVQQGRYYLEQPIELKPDDHGLEIRGAENADVVIHGGRLIGNWQRDGDTFWSANLPEVQDGNWDFRLLVVNDRLCPRARLPKEGIFTHLSVFDVPWMSTTGGGWQRKPTAQELTTMKYRPEDLGDWLDVKNAEVTVYHMWDESVVGIVRNDDLAGQTCLTFSKPCGHPPGAFGVQKYVVWNVREGHDRARAMVPGPDGRQSRLLAAAGRGDANGLHVVAPTVPSILRSADRPTSRFAT